MAKVIENICVGCPKGCVQCGRKEEEIIVCDKCEDFAEYSFGGADYCADCFEEELDYHWDTYSLTDRAKMLGFSFEKVG